MTLEIILFILFGAVAAISSVIMITRSDAVISALFLVLNLASIAGLYLLLNAQFIAVAQVIVYAGAIMVLFLFVIMLLRPQKESIFENKPAIKIMAIVITILVFLQIAYMIFFSKSGEVTGEVAASVNAGTVESIGRTLFINYVVPFEAAGFLLLAATIGALVLAKKNFK
jgi:NADH-quinone oxidoreductase subunit J